MDEIWQWISANPIVIVVAAAVIGIPMILGIMLDLRRRQTRLEKEDDQEEVDRRIDERERRDAQRKKDLALTCEKCEKLAEPIARTGNRYRCNHCGNQFAGANHGI